MSQEVSVSKEKYKVVVVGGGTGTHTVLRGLKQYHEQLDLTAIVTMADSGGSTGRLRDEFGYLPVGDARMALIALATDVNAHDDLMRELFLYRFSKGEGLSGHNFGNLLLTALTDILGSEVEAIETASRILRVRGRVIPVTTDNVQLQARYSDGKIAVGENVIDEPDETRLSQVIDELSVTPRASINPHASKALSEADLIVFGPGDLYTSIIANCVVDGFADAIQKTTAKTAFVSNLMTKAGQTTGMDAVDHLKEIEKYCSVSIDTCLVHSDILPEDLVSKYAEEKEFPVEVKNKEKFNCEVIETSLLAEESVMVNSSDTVRRSLIRHDPDKLALSILSILKT